MGREVWLTVTGEQKDADGPGMREEKIRISLNTGKEIRRAER